MSWNYRIVDVSDGVEEPIFEIREVYYNKNDQPFGHANASIVGETLKEMQEVLYKFAEAFNHPILHDSSDFSNDFDH